MIKKYAEKKLLEWQESEVNSILERSRKQQHFESTEKTCNATITSVVPKLQNTLMNSLDSDSITLLLRQKTLNKKQKLELWEQLKVIAFTRVTCQVYTNVMLAILLKIQINILGAYLYQANQKPSNSELELCPEAQSKFLSSSNYFLTTGSEQFCLMIEKVVSSQVANMTLKDRLTLVDLETTLLNIHCATEKVLKQQPSGFIASFMLPANDDTTIPVAVGKLTSETREVLESQEVSELISMCCKSGFSCILDKFTESVIALADKTSSNSDFVHPNRLTFFVAKMIPVLNNSIFQEVWPMQLLNIDSLRVFGANIYESFSC